MGMRSLLHSSPAPRTSLPHGLYSLTQPYDELASEELARRKRVLGRFPTLDGKYDFSSFQFKDDPQFKKTSEYGDFRSKSPYRDDTPAADTISHFPSPGGEALEGAYQQYKPLINTAQENRPGSVVAGQDDASLDKKLDQARKYFSPWSAKKEDLMKDVETSSSKLQESKYEIDILNDKELRDKVALRAFYKTTTAKLYEGVDWSERIFPVQTPPSTTLEGRPDLVTKKIKRYNDRAEDWQRLSKTPFSWDYFQPRDRHFIQSPLSFTSENTKGGQIPNYAGTIPGEGDKDVTGKAFSPFTVVRTPQPRYAETGRRGYIPGYQGSTLWSSPNPPFGREKEPRAESTARAHRPMTYGPNYSKYSHQGPLSRGVTLSHPFNPYNNVQPRHCNTASGLRV